MRRGPTLMRCVGLVLLVGCLAVGDACADTLSRFNPFASFETRCEAVGPARIEVTAVPVTFSEDYSQSLRTLSRMNDGMEAGHRTVGLTQGRLAYESTLETKGLEDRRARRFCARASITVVFTATPMTVYVAREFADDDCRRQAIRAHEMKHVAVYRHYLGELVDRARQELATFYGGEVIYARNLESSQDAMRTRLTEFMHAFMQTSYAEIKARQADVDTPEEYRRLFRGCGPPSPG